MAPTSKMPVALFRSTLTAHPRPGLFGQIDATGAATLGGTLDISLPTGVCPDCGSQLPGFALWFGNGQLRIDHGPVNRPLAGLANRPGPDRFPR